MHLHNSSKIKSHEEVTKQYKLSVFILILLNDGRSNLFLYRLFRWYYKILYDDSHLLRVNRSLWAFIPIYFVVPNTQKMIIWVIDCWHPPCIDWLIGGIPVHWLIDCRRVRISAPDPAPRRAGSVLRATRWTPSTAAWWAFQGTSGVGILSWTKYT